MGKLWILSRRDARGLYVPIGSYATLDEAKDAAGLARSHSSNSVEYRVQQDGAPDYHQSMLTLGQRAVWHHFMGEEI